MGIDSQSDVFALIPSESSKVCCGEGPAWQMIRRCSMKLTSKFKVCMIWMIYLFASMKHGDMVVMIYHKFSMGLP